MVAKYRQLLTKRARTPKKCQGSSAPSTRKQRRQIEQDLKRRFKQAHPQKRATSKNLDEYERRSIASKKGWETRKLTIARQYVTDYYRWFTESRDLPSNAKDALFVEMGLKERRNRMFKRASHIKGEELAGQWREYLDIVNEELDFEVSDIEAKYYFLRMIRWSE